MGPPGSGKGTQATHVAKNLRVESVSSGDLFRDHQRRDTELGRLAKSYMEKGVYVPDEVTIGMVMDWINDPSHCAGFVLDGFPRTQAQAEALDAEMAGERGIDRVVFIRVSEDELVRRLTGRLICRGCQSPFHRHFFPPEEAGICDSCGGELYQRDDDKEEVVSTRIRVYNEQTEPVVDYYRQAGVLREVDGEQDVETVGRAMRKAIDA